MLDFKDPWESHVPLIKFAYNNSYQVTIQMAPYETLYERQCRLLLCWNEVGEARVIELEIIQETRVQVKLTGKDGHDPN